MIHIACGTVNFRKLPLREALERIARAGYRWVETQATAPFCPHVDPWRDDPEGFRVWDETEAARAGDRDIYLLSNLHQVGSVQINAFQRIADVVIQKSLREGFGLTVSEALWKGRPVVGGRAGGITLQIREGYDGYLVDSVEECASRIIDLLADPVGSEAMGAQGREHVRDNFLCTRELADWLTLFGRLGNDEPRSATRS